MMTSDSVFRHAGCTLQAGCAPLRSAFSISVYAGLSLAATRQCRLLRCVEVNPQGRQPFLDAAAALAAPDSVPSSSKTGLDCGRGGRHGSNGCIIAECGTVFEYIVSTAAAAAADGAFAGIDVVTVDPPRKVGTPHEEENAGKTSIPRSASSFTSISKLPDTASEKHVV